MANKTTAKPDPADSAPVTSAAEASTVEPAPVNRPAEPALDDGLVEVTVTQYGKHNGQAYTPGDTIRVTPDRADSLRWAGHAKPAKR